MSYPVWGPDAHDEGRAEGASRVHAGTAERYLWIE